MASPKQIWSSFSLYLLCSLYLREVSGYDSAEFTAWIYPRTGIVREFLYIEGGLPYNNSGADFPSSGLLYSFDLCNSTTSETLKDGVPLNLLPEATGRAPLYYSGTMFSDAYEFYAYGGVVYPTAEQFSLDHPVLNWQFYGADAQTAGLGENHIIPDNGVTNNVAFGAGVSVPRQSLGFYFSGLQAPSGGVLSSAGNKSDAASVLTSSMVTLDMSEQGAGTWSNQTLPSYIVPRAEASLTWVPVGKKGLLIAIGGITNPADATATQKSNATDQDQTFLTSVPVYDIANNVWYLQPVEGPDGASLPPTIASFCTVMAHPANNTSFQIYAYGGYDGTYTTSTKAYSQVWALSVPRFKWYPISVPGNPSVRRIGHSCEMLDANTMLAVGGSIEYQEQLNASTFDIFDLSSQAWTGQYTPGNNTEYQVPEVIAQDLAKGQMSSGMNSTLANLFNNNEYADLVQLPVLNCQRPHSHGPKASVIAPAVAVPVAVLAALGVLFFWFVRRRKKAGRPVSWFSTASTKRASGVAAIPKSDSESTHVNAYELANRDYFGPKRAIGNATEVSGTPITTPPMSLLGRGSPLPGDAPGSPHSGPSELPHSTHPTSTRDSMSLRDHHMHPVGYASDGVNSNWGDDRSAASRSEYAYPNMSARLFELPGSAQNRGLPDPLAASIAHPNRPHHERNASSLSETRPMPASPTPDEDARRSQAIDNLPSPGFSPTTPGAGTGSGGSYEGRFNEIFRDREI